MQLPGSTFLISGGASGLGAAAVRLFAANQANVVIADLNNPAGEALAQEIGATARFVRTDVTDETSTRAAVAAALEIFGGLQGAINCAGIGIAEQAGEGRQHACPALALGHPLRRAEGGERDARLGSRDDVPAIEERLQRSPEGAVRERQALGRDRREHGRRACRSGGERVEQIEPEERGGEAGRRGTQHTERSGTPLRVARDVRCRIA